MDKSLTHKIMILAQADLRSGVSKQRLRDDIKKYSDTEQYEICAGLKLALQNNSNE